MSEVDRRRAKTRLISAHLSRNGLCGKLTSRDLAMEGLSAEDLAAEQPFDPLDDVDPEMWEVSCSFRNALSSSTEIVSSPLRCSSMIFIEALALIQVTAREISLESRAISLTPLSRQTSGSCRSTCARSDSTSTSTCGRGRTFATRRARIISRSSSAAHASARSAASSRRSRQVRIRPGSRTRPPRILNRCARC